MCRPFLRGLQWFAVHRRLLLVVVVLLGTALAPAGASAAPPRVTVTLPGDAAAASVRADR